MKSNSIQTSPEGNIASVNGTQMYYEIYGEGPPLVLIHGFTQSSQDWHPFIEDFAKHYRLVIPDLRGHGRSTNPTNQITGRQSALDIFALLDQLEINQFRAIGISFGGVNLIHMATQQPARVRAMVLVGTPSHIPVQTRAMWGKLTVDRENWDWEKLQQRHVYGDDQIRTLINQFQTFKDDYDDPNFTPPYLSTITAKTLIVHGDRDEQIPVSISVEMYTAIPNAYLWIVPDGDHVPIMEGRAQQFTQIALEFLRGE